MFLSPRAQEGESVPNEGVGVTDHVAPQRRGADERLLLWVRRSVSAFVRGLRLDVLEYCPVDNSVCVVR